MTNKTDMIQRQKALLDSLNNDTFDRQTFLKEHNILDRTLRRDLNALAERGEIFENRLAILRKKCLGKLTKKANDGELTDSMMLQIVMSSQATKHEIISDSNVNISGLEPLNALIKLSKEETTNEG